jgi:hypothetical protein
MTKFVDAVMKFLTAAEASEEVGLVDGDES